MQKIDILKKIFEEKKVIRTKDLKEFDIDRKFLEVAVQRGICEKVARGIYVSEESLVDSQFVNQLKYKNSLYALESALVLHNYIDSIYIKHVFITDKKLENKKFIFIKGDTKVGVTKVTTEFNNIVYVTDMERTMCDLVRYRKYIDAEVYSKTFKKYINSPNKDINKIIKYAIELDCFNEVNKVFEVFYGW